MTIETALLKSIPYFSSLSSTELEAVKKHVFEKSAERNDIIFLEDEPAEAVYFLVSGVIKSFKTSIDGKEQILGIIRPGESFNDVPIFDSGPNPASAIAMSPVTLYGIKKGNMEILLQEHPGIAMNIIRVLAGSVRRLVSLVEDLSFRNVISRVARLLMEYSADSTDPVKDPASRPKLTQQDMAAMVGTAREVVGRSLKALEEGGAIKIDRHRIVIINKGILEEMSSAARR